MAELNNHFEGFEPRLQLPQSFELEPRGILHDLYIVLFNKEMNNACRVTIPVFAVLKRITKFFYDIHYFIS